METDLAVLKVEAENLIPVEFADSESVKVGELAVAIGNPLGTLGGTVTDGIVSAKDRKISIVDEITNQEEVITVLQTSAAVNRGNSGGGLFDEHGKLIGIVNAKSSGTEGLGFAIPSNLVKEIVDVIMKDGYVSGRAQLNIETVEIIGQESLFIYRLDEEGVYVAKNHGDSDLEIGDKIEAINNEKVESNNDIKSIIRTLKVGDTVKVTVKREGKLMDVDVVLTESVPEQ